LLVQGTVQLASPADQAARAITSRETSTFLFACGALLLVVHGVDASMGGGPNWPALGTRCAWAAILWVEAWLLRRQSHRAILARAAGVIFGSVVCHLTLMAQTGGSASPLLPFVLVLNILLPVMGFEFIWVGLSGSVLLLSGAVGILLLDNASREQLIRFIKPGGIALVCGAIIARALRQSRRLEETRLQALTESLRTNDALVTELRAALAQAKTLSGLLPICAWCRRVRNDAGYWLQLEAYITAHSDARFSHGLCQECMDEHFPEDPEAPK
jgi:hypothetical protein